MSIEDENRQMKEGAGTAGGCREGRGLSSLHEAALCDAFQSVCLCKRERVLERQQSGSSCLSLAAGGRRGMYY